MKYETRITSLTVVPMEKPLFSEDATTISITDEAGGEFIQIEQGESPGRICIDAEEWPHIRDAIEQLIKDCR